MVRGALKPGGCVPARTPVSTAPYHTVPGSGWHQTACRPHCWWSRAAALRPSRPAQGQTELRQGQGASNPQLQWYTPMCIYTGYTQRCTQTHGCTHKHIHTRDTPVPSLGELWAKSQDSLPLGPGGGGGTGQGAGCRVQVQGSPESQALAGAGLPTPYPALPTHPLCAHPRAHSQSSRLPASRLCLCLCLLGDPEGQQGLGAGW